MIQRKLRRIKLSQVFKALSGRPKDGDIIECIRPMIVMPQLMMTLLLMAWGIGSKNFLFGLLALLFAWQMGWGMSIERFSNSEKKQLTDSSEKEREEN